MEKEQSKKLIETKLVEVKRYFFTHYSSFINWFMCHIYHLNSNVQCFCSITGTISFKLSWGKTTMGVQRYIVTLDGVYVCLFVECNMIYAMFGTCAWTETKGWHILALCSLLPFITCRQSVPFVEYSTFVPGGLTYQTQVPADELLEHGFESWSRHLHVLEIDTSVYIKSPMSC